MACFRFCFNRVPIAALLPCRIPETSSHAHCVLSALSADSWANRKSTPRPFFMRSTMRYPRRLTVKSIATAIAPCSVVTSLSFQVRRIWSSIGGHARGQLSASLSGSKRETGLGCCWSSRHTPAASARDRPYAGEMPDCPVDNSTRFRGTDGALAIASVVLSEAGFPALLRYREGGSEVTASSRRISTMAFSRRFRTKFSISVAIFSV